MRQCTGQWEYPMVMSNVCLANHFNIFHHWTERIDVLLIVCLVRCRMNFHSFADKEFKRLIWVPVFEGFNCTLFELLRVHSLLSCLKLLSEPHLVILENLVKLRAIKFVFRNIDWFSFVLMEVVLPKSLLDVSFWQNSNRSSQKKSLQIPCRNNYFR